MRHRSYVFRKGLTYAWTSAALEKHREFLNPWMSCCSIDTSFKALHGVNPWWACHPPWQGLDTAPLVGLASLLFSTLCQ